AAQLADHDAGGLIVVTDLEPDDLQTRRIGSASEREDISIPIFEMTEPAFETLLDQLDLELSDLTFASTTLPLGVQVRQSLVRLPLTTTLTANVIGLLPGSEPELADQVIVVGANYDHIGGEPDGLLYPGANHNASGVAGLLEVARVWRDEGYRPARSVLFVAWGAEELDSAGAAYYLEHPALPLTQTVGVISLDGIGAGEGRKLLYFGRRDHDAALIHPVDMGADQLGRRVWRRGSTGEGWHALFSQEEIPTLKLIWEEAEEGFYLSNDTVENIDLEKLATGGEVLTLVLSWLAGQ
ncbi:MAG: M20/M25/M40 family metallo-hydrolase, partial [Anaerolineae bacterium]